MRASWSHIHFDLLRFALLTDTVSVCLKENVAPCNQYRINGAACVLSRNAQEPQPLGSMRGQ